MRFEVFFFAKMARLIVTLVIAFALSSDAARTTERYESYNSSDLSYLSNGIQFPVPTTEETDPILEEVTQEDLPQMEWMSRLYDHHRWDQHLGVLSNTRCRDDMVTYLAALDNGTSWAAKSWCNRTFSCTCIANSAGCMRLALNALFV